MADVIDLSLDSGGEDEGAGAEVASKDAASASVEALVTVFANVTACKDLARARRIIQGSMSRGLGIEHAIEYFYNTGGVGAASSTSTAPARASAKRTNLAVSASPPAKRARTPAAEAQPKEKSKSKAKSKAKSKKRKSPSYDAASSAESSSSSTTIPTPAAAPVCVSRPAPFVVSMSRSDFTTKFANGADNRINEGGATAHDGQMVMRQRKKIVADIFTSGTLTLNLVKVKRGKKDRTDPSKNPNFQWSAFASSSFASGLSKVAFVALLQKRHKAHRGVGDVPTDWSTKVWTKYALAAQRWAYQVCDHACHAMNDESLKSATEAAAAKLIQRVADGRG